MASMPGASPRATRAELFAVIAAQQDQIAALIDTVAGLRRVNEELASRVRELETRNAELQVRVGKNSRNSSKPPSSDPVFDKPGPKPKSLRKSSGQKPGKQPGSAGRHLERAASPDQVRMHAPQLCDGCGGSLATAQTGDVSVRQVFDLPVIELEVIEHQVQAKQCACGHITRARFPAEATAPACYGPRLQALGVYLLNHQHLPVARAAELLSQVLGAHVSTGWVGSLQHRAAQVLEEDFTGDLEDRLRESAVAHFDETGARIAGRLGWVHTAVTESLSSYHLDDKRGTEAMEAHGILPAFTGIAVHDGWAPYRTYDQIDHGLCNAHLLRELAAMTETGTQPWAAQMADLLTGAHRSVEAAKADGQPGLDPDVLTGFIQNYDRIVAAGQAANPPPPRTGKRGRPALGKAGSLLKRFEDYRQDVLRFATDFQVPFDNNIAEQSIRMVKLQQKISGTWRTRTGATDFLTIRSYLATARKHGQHAFGVLRDLFTGQTWTIPT